ncbi:MAG: B12-binding domain-containing radical SAM protein [Candidatus Helarchaeota archaeon]
MNVLLIYPPFKIGSGMGKVMLSPPLSVMQLAGMIPDHRVEILDLNVNPQMTIAQIEQEISKFDLVGVSTMTSGVRVALNLCKLAKRHEVTTVLGGFHPTLRPEVMKYPEVDYIVRGEGEYTFKELVEGVHPSEILGLGYRDNGNYMLNEPRPFIENLDTLPYARKDLLNYSKYHYLWIPADVIESSRGCPFDCNFCCVTKFYCRTYRKKSPLRVMKEIARVPPSQKLVFFVDDNFTLDHKRVDRICDLIQQYGYHKRLMFVCQTRVDDIARSPEMVRKMAKSGFICFFVGFESLRQMSLNTMNKQTRLSQVRKAIQICHDNAIIVFGSFIIGNIGETKEDTLRTLRMMKELEIDIMMTNPLTPFPGTKLWDEAVVNGWVKEDFDWASWDFNAMMRTPDMSIEEIQELLDYSYRFFYKDIGYFLFGKKLLRMMRPKARKFWKIMPNFLMKGLKNFFIKIN